MTSAFRNFRFVALVASAFWVGVSLPVAPTVCIGADGHVVFDLAPSQPVPCCEPAAAAPADDCVPEGCEDCTDITLSAGRALRTQGRDAATSSPDGTILPHSLATAAFGDRSDACALPCLPRVRCTALTRILPLRC